MFLKKLSYLGKQYPRLVAAPIWDGSVLRPLLRAPPRPFLRPAPPLPFTLPPPKPKHRFKLPQMLVTPPPPLPSHLVIPRTQQKYIEINKQLLVRPSNLMIELTFSICRNEMIDDPLFASLTQKVKNMYLLTPAFRVHGMRLCFLDSNNTLCYLNHQNQRFLDAAARMEETEAARRLILEDLRLRGDYDITVTVDDLALIWYDDSNRDPIDFWIYQYLKHGYYAKNDPMPDYASEVACHSLPLFFPRFYPYNPSEDCDACYMSLHDYLFKEGFFTNQYHTAERFRLSVAHYFYSTPRISYIDHYQYRSLREISVLRTHPEGLPFDHPLSICLPGSFFMRMI